MFWLRVSPWGWDLIFTCTHKGFWLLLAATKGHNNGWSSDHKSTIRFSDAPPGPVCSSLCFYSCWMRNIVCTNHLPNIFFTQRRSGLSLWLLTISVAPMVLQTSAEMLKKSHASSPIGQIKPCRGFSFYSYADDTLLYIIQPPHCHMSIASMKLKYWCHFAFSDTITIKRITLLWHLMPKSRLLGIFSKTWTAVPSPRPFMCATRGATWGSFIYLLVTLFIYVRNL